MSVDGTRLLFEGFLQKRKDVIKIRWMTYWFRLQNTTLFFYTRKNGSASHLRGLYYIYTVQSVREVQSDRSRFMFEIIMKSGKRKLLAAETADLRKEWVEQLWQAMHLSGCRISDFRLELPDESEQEEEAAPEAPSARPRSDPAPSVQICWDSRSEASPVRQPQEQNCGENVYENVTSAVKRLHQSGDLLQELQWPSGWTSAPEGNYDVLPLRNQKCEPPPLMNEVIYDTPVSHRMSAGHQETAESIYDTPGVHNTQSIYDTPSIHDTPSIYDSPSTLLRERPTHTTDEEEEGGIYWRI